MRFLEDQFALDVIGWFFVLQEAFEQFVEGDWVLVGEDCEASAKSVGGAVLRDCFASQVTRRAGALFCISAIGG